MKNRVRPRQETREEMELGAEEIRNQLLSERKITNPRRIASIDRALAVVSADLARVLSEDCPTPLKPVTEPASPDTQNQISILVQRCMLGDISEFDLDALRQWLEDEDEDYNCLMDNDEVQHYLLKKYNRA